MRVDISQRVHSTRLKQHPLQQCPELTSYKDGQEVLAFNEDIAAVLKKATENNIDCKAM